MKKSINLNCVGCKFLDVESYKCKYYNSLLNELKYCGVVGERIN